MNKFNRLVVAAALMSSALSLVGVRAQSAAPTVPVKIAIMAPITGPAGSIGTEQLNWAQMAVDDFNTANSGWKIELVQGDTQLDASKAVTVADSLISNNDIYAVVGPAGSQEVEATQQKFKDARLVAISGSATRTSLTQNGFDTFFRVVPTDAEQGPTDAQFLASLGKTKLFIIDDQTSYATGLADDATTAFKAAGGTVVDHQSVTQQDTDFSALVTRIKTSGADAVFFPGQIASQGGLLGQQLAEQNVSVVLLGSDGMFDPDKFIKAAGGGTEGAYVSSFAPDIHGIAADADQVKAYTTKYGEFGTFGPATYAATWVELEAIKAASDAGTLTRAAVRDAVAKTDEKTSILGIPVSFDKNGDVKGAQFFLFQVKGDAFVLVPGPAAAGASATMAATMSADMSATMAATAAK